MDVIIGLGFWKLRNPRYVIRLVSFLLSIWWLEGWIPGCLWTSSDRVLLEYFFYMLMQLGSTRILTVLLTEHIFVWCGRNVVNVFDTIFLFFMFRLILWWRYSPNLWLDRYLSLDFPLITNYRYCCTNELSSYCILDAGMEDAKIVGGIPKMCLTNTTTFFSCTTTGIVWWFIILLYCAWRRPYLYCLKMCLILFAVATSAAWECSKQIC